MAYLEHLTVLFCMWLILCTALNIVVGYGGMLSLFPAAIFGLSSYSWVLGINSLGLTPVLALVFSLIVVTLSVTIFASVLLRLPSSTFALGSLASQVIIYSVIYNATSITNGPYGISNIPRLATGLIRDRQTDYLLFSLCLAAISVSLLSPILLGPYGITLRATRDDETAALSLGKDVRVVRRSALMLSGLITVPVGALFASYSRYIDPTSYTLDESMSMLCAVVIGGSGTFGGSALGALIVVLAPEVLRLVALPPSVAGPIRQILFALAILGIMRKRPQGVLGDYSWR